MFRPSKMPIEDVGDRLMVFFNDLDAENRKAQLRREIQEARYLLKSLKDKEKALKDSLLQSDQEVFNASINNQDQENLSFRTSEVFKLCYGVELSVNDIAKEAKLLLTPSHNGIFYGPFNIVFSKKGADFYIKSYQLLEERSLNCQTDVQDLKSIMKKRHHREFTKKPYSIVPLTALIEKFLKPGECDIWQFSKSVNSYLSAYISRLVQIKKLQEDFGSDCTDLEFDSKITKLAFTLNINDYGEDNTIGSSPGFKVCITLKYDLTCDLPKPGSLGLVVQNDAVVSLGVDGVEELKKQAEILYIKPLSDAIIEGF